MMYKIIVKGVVQGVGFRPSVKRTADRLGAKGSVRNDGSHVTIFTDHDPEELMERIKKTVGPMARIDEWSAEEIEAEPPDEGFIIDISTRGERDSSLPPDTAICHSCLGEMTDPENRRYLYPFTNCTDCGARYTLIEGLPYDRERTSMGDFEMCGECSEEYSDVNFRRFHAQTLSCSKKGPRYRFLNRDLEIVSEGYDAFISSARTIADGGSVVMKSWGGYHIVCHPAHLHEMRRTYNRPYKPFALMARDLGTAGKLGRLSDETASIMGSPARPVVLLKKRSDVKGGLRKEMEMASPGLDSIGIYLPYSGIQHLLFRALEEIGSPLDRIVMTSANPPGRPMALELKDVKELEADGYLDHDRRISARCDDSVLVPHPENPQNVLRSRGPFGIGASLVRKARGLIPDPLPIHHQQRTAAFGAERNVTVTVTKNGKAFTSPYIGNSRYSEVLDHIDLTRKRFMDLFGVEELDSIMVDLHPRYETSRIGEEVAEELSVPLFKVQHHKAHAASLLVDSGLESLPVIVVDGVGHGEDGRPWGGEVISASHPEVKRIGHLQNFGLPGGDSSVYHPERIAHWLTYDNGMDLDIGDRTASRILGVSHDQAVMTSSLGRLLDALSALLLKVTWRTYDGEPAMRLERLLGLSREPEKELFRFPLKDGEVNVIDRWKVLLESVFEDGRPELKDLSGDRRTADIAMGMIGAILDDMVNISLEKGPARIDDGQRRHVGWSGGVAYNTWITSAFIESCRSRDAVPVLHSRVPPGDGGISIGQASFAGTML